MTNQTRILAAAAGVLVMAAVSPAIAQTIHLVARVPFEFHVGDTTMPRDVYRISRAQEGSSTLILRSQRTGTVVLAQPGGPSGDADKAQLVFHRIGDQYFLREVQLLGRSALTLPETPREREAMARIASAAPAGVQRVVITSPR